MIKINLKNIIGTEPLFTSGDIIIENMDTKKGTKRELFFVLYFYSSYQFVAMCLSGRDKGDICYDLYTCEYSKVIGDVHIEMSLKQRR